MMKMKNIGIKFYILLTFLLFIVSTFSSVAQFPEYKNRIALWGASGFANIANGAPKTETIGGMGLNIGAGYEFDYNNFMVQTGVELSHYASYMGMKDSLHIIPMFDTEGYPFDGYYTFRHTQDLQSITNVGFPLMIGYQTVSGYYFLAGAKVKLHLTGNSRVRTQVTSKAYYTNIIGDNHDGFFTNMPNHGLYTELRYVDTPIKMNTMFVGSLEVGTYLTANHYFTALRNTNTNMRLSLFCDYGFAPVKTSDKVDNIIVNISDTDEYIPAISGYLYHDVKSDFINTLLVGLKFTILFNVDKTPCTHCEFH